MKAIAWPSVVVGALFCVAPACSASSAGKNGGGDGATGSGATSSAGGTQPNLGGSIGTGGTVSIGGLDSGGLGSGGNPMGCNDLSIETKEVTPTVLLLVDNSSSMFEPRETLWDPLYNVLMKPTDGIVASLQSKVRFGFTSYRGEKMNADPACPNLFEVDYKLDNFDAINTVYQKQGQEFMPGIKWETPTGAAIVKAAEKLAAFEADPPGPKYIVLVTDGNPNTCGAIDPQCGSDESIKAVQDAKALGIGTFAVGIGDIVTTNSGCEAQWGRCGALHLQDLANAGQGLPVSAPPDSLRYQACTPTQTLAATYATAAETPGTAPYFTAANAAELETALKGLLNSVVSCTYDMNATVVGNAALGTVKINDVEVPYGDANGWKLEDNKVQITLQGTACDTFKSQPGAKLFVSFPCQVAVPK
jgi:von Willebrand factor type A domain